MARVAQIMVPTKFLVFYILLLCECALALWPQPRSIESGASVLWLSPEFDFSHQFASIVPLTGKQCQSYMAISDFQLLSPSEDDTKIPFSEMFILQDALNRTKRAVLSIDFVPWKFYSRGSNWEPVSGTDYPTLKTILIEQHGEPSKDAIVAKDFFAGDESYRISISADGAGKISSNSTIGTIRGLQTFEQLFYRHSDLTKTYLHNAPLVIEDAPEWPHRGLNLDISRNAFLPVDVFRTIKGMASCKMSRLHIHATDAQSWPIEIPALPTLAEKGAYQPHLIWSPKNVADVQIYGMRHGISVFLEIDMPGHTGSIALSHPDLIAAFNQSDWSTFAAQPPSGSLKLNSPAVYDFLGTLFSDLLPRLSPYTTYFHAGGDEVKNNAFLLDDTVMSNSSDVLQPLVQKLMENVTATVRAAGLTPIVWEEMVLDWNVTFPTDASAADSNVIVQVWRDAANLQSVLKKGFRAVFGDYKNWYLDCGHGIFLNPYPSGKSPENVPFNTSGGLPTQILDLYLDYCSPLKNWRHVYAYDPYVNITEDVRGLIHGGEVHLWSELTDPVSLDSKVWPRAAAAAEVMWSGPREAGLIEEASLRLGEWRERAVMDHGIQASVVQITWCLMEGGCNW